MLSSKAYYDCDPMVPSIGPNDPNKKCGNLTSHTFTMFDMGIGIIPMVVISGQILGW